MPVSAVSLAARAHPATAWCGVALVLALPALVLGASPLDPASAPPLHAALLWTREAAQQSPWQGLWRCWTAAWVHGSAMHLAANLVAVLLVALLGVVARVPPPAAWAWAAAWPLTQLGLLLDARLPAYGGLSGVLHAGVAVVAVWLLCAAPRVRGLGGLLLGGLLLKVGIEAPWREALVASPGLGIAVAPLAHATGVVAGAVMGAVVVAKAISSAAK